MGKIRILSKTIFKYLIVVLLSCCFCSVSFSETSCRSFLNNSQNISKEQLSIILKLKGYEVKNYILDRNLTEASESLVNDLLEEFYYQKDGDAFISILELFNDKADSSWLSAYDRIVFLFESTRDGNIDRFYKLINILGISFYSPEFYGLINSDGENAYHVAIIARASQEALEVLFDYPLVDINLVTNRSHGRGGSQTPLMLAIERGEVELVESLLKHRQLILHTFGMYFSGSLLTYIKVDGLHRLDIERIDDGTLDPNRENDRTQILKLVIEDERLGIYPNVDEGQALIGAPYFSDSEVEIILENPWVNVNSRHDEFGSILDFAISFDNLNLAKEALKRPDIDLYNKKDRKLNSIQFALEKLLTSRSRDLAKKQEPLFWSLVDHHDNTQLSKILEVKPNVTETKSKENESSIEELFVLKNYLEGLSKATIETAIESGDFKAVNLYLDESEPFEGKNGLKKLQRFVRLAFNETLKKPDHTYNDRVEIRDKFLRLMINAQLWSF